MTTRGAPATTAAAFADRGSHARLGGRPGRGWQPGRQGRAQVGPGPWSKRTMTTPTARRGCATRPRPATKSAAIAGRLEVKSRTPCERPRRASRGRSCARAARLACRTDVSETPLRTDWPPTPAGHSTRSCRGRPCQTVSPTRRPTGHWWDPAPAAATLCSRRRPPRRARERWPAARVKGGRLRKSALPTTCLAE